MFWSVVPSFFGRENRSLESTVELDMEQIDVCAKSIRTLQDEKERQRGTQFFLA